MNSLSKLKIKTIKLDETFESLKELTETLDSYAKENHLVHSLTDTKLLKNVDQTLIDRFKYKYMEYRCIHGPKRKCSYVNKNIRPNTHTSKVDCPYKIRVNFDEKIKSFKIKIFVSDHNHKIGEDLFCHYASQRKPTEEELKELVKLQCKTGAKASTLVNNYNDEKGTNFLTKDFNNFTQKLNKALHQTKDDLIEEFFDEVKKNPNNTVETLISKEGVMECAFIMLDVQTQWLQSYHEIVHLDGTYDTIEMLLDNRALTIVAYLH
jgi:hypothetical protein